MCGKPVGGLQPRQPAADAPLASTPAPVPIRPTATPRAFSRRSAKASGAWPGRPQPRQSVAHPPTARRAHPGARVVAAAEHLAQLKPLGPDHVADTESRRRRSRGSRASESRRCASVSSAKNGMSATGPRAVEAPGGVEGSDPEGDVCSEGVLDPGPSGFEPGPRSSREKTTPISRSSTPAARAPDRVDRAADTGELGRGIGPVGGEVAQPSLFGDRVIVEVGDYLGVFGARAAPARRCGQARGRSAARGRRRSRELGRPAAGLEAPCRRRRSSQPGPSALNLVELTAQFLEGRGDALGGSFVQTATISRGVTVAMLPTPPDAALFHSLMFVFGCAVTDDEIYREYAEPGIRLAADPIPRSRPLGSAGTIFRNYNLYFDNTRIARTSRPWSWSTRTPRSSTPTSARRSRGAAGPRCRDRRLRRRDRRAQHRLVGGLGHLGVLRPPLPTRSAAARSRR